MWQLKEIAANNKTLSGCPQTTSSSKISSIDKALERAPMIDISNKLHAMVDEFVSNLSSECNSLANNISSQTQLYATLDNGPESVSATRSSNRTTTEVLNGLRRPHGDHSGDIQDREGELQMLNGTPNLRGRNTRDREGRLVRHVRDKKPRRLTLEGTVIENDATSVEIDSENNLSADEPQRGRGPDGMDAIHILSSDPSSDEWLRTKKKYSKK